MGGGSVSRRLGTAIAVAAIAVSISVTPASAHESSDPLHGGQGAGVTVIGHSDLGGAGLNGHLDVLGDYAYVGAGTNGGFAAQWNKTPKCDAQPNKVKVVSLKDPANPTVVSTIDVTGAGEDPGATVARAVSVIRVKPLAPANAAFTGDLLAVALESCGGNGRLGVDLYNVSDPSRPTRLGTDTPVIGTATRDVSLVQRPDGRILALEANQSGGIREVDVTAPTAPVPVGTFSTTSSGQGCRPFSFAQGVTANAAGSRAYAAFGDAGLLTLDISNPMPGTPPSKLAQALYGASEEGNSFRFVPNGDETAALATDEDLLPAQTTLTVKTGPAAAVTEPGASAPGVFRGCEAIWGNPLYRQATPSLADREVVFVPNNGCPEGYAGDVPGKVVLVDRGGSGACFDFDGKARIAQQRGAAAVLVANTSATAPVFSPDATAAGDARVTIPLAMVRKEAGDAIKAGLAGNQTVTGTLADNPDTWGALRVFNLPPPPANPTQAAVFNAPHTKVLTPGDGLYHAVNPLWDGDRALVAWMSDGLRVVDLKDRSAPKAGGFYVPPGVSDPTGNYGKVPLVVDVAKLGDRVVISDINGGLYVLELRDPTAAGGGGAQGVAGGGAGARGARRCVSTRGGIRRTGVGVARLGRTRTGQRRILKGTLFSDRPGIDRYCVREGGGSLRVGYPTKRLNAKLSKKTRKRIKGKAVLLVSTSKAFRLSKAKIGTGTKTLARRLKGERRLKIGRNTWYVAQGKRARILFRTRKGKVLEMGLADKRLTTTRGATVRLLRAWDKRGKTRK